MNKGTERGRIGTYIQSALRGAVGLAVFLLLLLLAAILSEKAHWLMKETCPVAEGCLLIGAILSGASALRNVVNRRLLHALAGETILLLFLAANALFASKDGRLLSLLIDLMLLFIGAFAGTFLRMRHRVKQRGKK